MDRDHAPRRTAVAAGDGDIDGLPRALAQDTEVVQRVQVGEGGALTAGEDRGRPLALDGQELRRDQRVDAVVDPVQPPVGRLRPDRGRSEAELAQLREGEHRVLAARDRHRPMPPLMRVEFRSRGERFSTRFRRRVRRMGSARGRGWLL